MAILMPRQADRGPGLHEILGQPGGAASASVTFFIVRHGATKFNKQAGASKEVKSKDVERAWSDVPLTEEGRQEAQKAGLKLKAEGIEALFASTLVRGAQTAKIIGPIIGVQPQLLDDLRTWNLGDLMGEQAKDVEPRVMEFISHPDMPVPGGETFNEFKSRIHRALQHIVRIARNARVAVVVHHRVERLLEAWQAAGEPESFDIDLKTFLEQGEAPGSIEVIQVKEDAVRGDDRWQAQAESSPEKSQTDGGEPSMKSTKSSGMGKDETMMGPAERFKQKWAATGKMPMQEMTETPAQEAAETPRQEAAEQRAGIERPNSQTLAHGRAIAGAKALHAVGHISARERDKHVKASQKAIGQRKPFGAFAPQ